MASIIASKFVFCIIVRFMHFCRNLKPSHANMSISLHAHVYHVYYYYKSKPKNISIYILDRKSINCRMHAYFKGHCLL